MNGSYEKERNKNEEKEEKHYIQRFTDAVPDRSTRISYAAATAGTSCRK